MDLRIPRDLFNNFFVSSQFGGSYLPFDKQEQHLANIVFPIALEEVSRNCGIAEVNIDDISLNWAPEDLSHANSRSSPVGPPVDEFNVKVVATIENLKKILELFEKIHTAREKFVSSYPGWEKIRRKNVEDLKVLGNSMHNDRFNCNVSRLVGSSVGAIGGAALVACLLPMAAPVIVPLSIAAGGASLAGGGVVFGTTATEYGLIKSKIAKAQEILKDDKEGFQPMAKYFQQTIDFVEAVDAVLGFQLMKTLAEDLKEFINDVASWNDIFKTKIRDIFANLAKKNMSGIGNTFKMLNSDTLKMLNPNNLKMLNPDNLKLCNIQAQIVIQSLIYTFIVVAVLAHKKNCLILSSVILTHRLVFGFLSGLDLGAEVGRGVMMALKGGQITAEISSQLGKAVSHGVFAGVGLALDVINIVYTSIDVHTGSRSEQGTLILNAANKLAEESEFLEKVYNELHVK